TTSKRNDREVCMVSNSSNGRRGIPGFGRFLAWATPLFLVSLFSAFAFAQSGAPHAGGEDSLVIPSQLDTLEFFGLAARNLLLLGLIVCAGGVSFGLVVYAQLKNA